MMRTYEIYTPSYSEIVEATTMISAIMIFTNKNKGEIILRVDDTKATHEVNKIHSAKHKILDNPDQHIAHSFCKYNDRCMTGARPYKGECCVDWEKRMIKEGKL